MTPNPINTLLPVPSGILEVPHDFFRDSSVGENTNHSPLRLSLVLPTYNESQNIEPIIKRLTLLLDSTVPEDYELIVVDDDSPDYTWKIALEMMSDYPQLRVMRRCDEKGLSTAVVRGWQVAQGEVLGVIDADLQHPPETVLQLLGEIEKGADLAVASRNVEDGGVSDWSITRRILSRGAQLLGLIILPGVIGRVSDPMSGFFMVRRECIAKKPLNPKGYKILIEVLGRGNIRWIGEVGYVFQERQEGESKVTWKQYLEYLEHLIRLRLALWPVGRFLRFGVVGFSGVFVDMGVFYLLRNLLHLALTRSAILSSEVAIISNFLWNDLWTFGDISQRQPGKRRMFKRFLKFNVVCLMGLIINVLIVNFLFNVFHVNEYLAKLVAIAVVTLWNFWINLKLNWRVTETKNQ
jgi:dolichol-phosphate mannosyltransferase